MSELRKLVAGNWKMNGLRASVAELDAILDGAGSVACDLAICPPFPLVAAFGERAQGSPLAIGAQDCHFAENGAHTGDVSAVLLADCGASTVILGHSERRGDHAETSELVRRKTEAALAAGLVPIVCVGETEAERDAGNAEQVVLAQLAGSLPELPAGTALSVAYEPVWAIGTGRVPEISDIGAMHRTMRDALVARFGESGRAFRLLYGGSVKPGNAAEIFAVPEVDGGLIGGASLKAADFLAIAAAA